MPFDRLNPVPRRTQFDIRATGAGEASPLRLRVALVFGLAAAALLFIYADAWWLGAWPLCLALFATHALSSQYEYSLDVRHVAAPTARRLLHILRRFLKFLIVTIAVAGLTFLIGTAQEWEWVMALLER